MTSMYGYDDVLMMSLDAICLLNDAGIPCVVLTKGLLPELLAGMDNRNSYGITLVSLDEEYRKRMEPYPTPNLVDQSLSEVLDAVSFVDRIVFGRTNYSTAVSSYPHAKEWYNERVREVTAFCEEHGIDLHVKKGTWTEGLVSVA